MSVYAQQSGKNVPLKQVADLKIEWQAAKILRRDLTRTISVTSELKSGYNAAEIMTHLAPWLEEQQKTWPSGYAYKLGGSRRERKKYRSDNGLSAPVIFSHCALAHRSI